MLNSNTNEADTIKFYGDAWRAAIINADFSKSEVGFAVLKIDSKDLAGKLVLDAGCGIGIHALAMVRGYGALVTGIDLSPTAIELARGVAKNAGVSIDFRIGDIMTLNELDDASFDTVVSIDSFQCTPDPLKCLRAFRRVLRPGGTVYISSLRDCWLVRRRSFMRAAMHALPRPLQQLGYRVLEFSVQLVTGGSASRERVTSIRAGLHEAFENTGYSVYPDPVWRRWLIESGFSNIELVCHWNVLKQHTVYRGRVPE